ncbi:MAG: hypothetical protein EOO88_22005, partial [Pedobacter sp.]
MSTPVIALFIDPAFTKKRQRRYDKILYLHQYFLTPEQGGAIRSYYLAKALVEKGYEVEVITSHNEKEDKTVIVEGIKVHYLSVYYDNSLGFIGRVSSFFNFINKS